ncbi:hypothetical protein H8E07_15125 [bacterium]|nr:hypothetical protein [bacterium]
MPISTIVKTKRDGTLTFEDNGAGNTLTVQYEAGDLSFTVNGEGVNNFLDRGLIGSPPSVRYGDDQPVTGSFTAYLRDLSDAAYATLEEIILRSGDVGANWVSTMGANGEVFTLTLRFTIEGTDHGDASDHVLTFDYANVTGTMAEGDPDTISINFTAYEVRPTVVT